MKATKSSIRFCKNLRDFLNDERKPYSVIGGMMFPLFSRMTKVSRFAGVWDWTPFVRHGYPKEYRRFLVRKLAAYFGSAFRGVLVTPPSRIYGYGAGTYRYPGMIKISLSSPERVEDSIKVLSSWGFKRVPKENAIFLPYGGYETGWEYCNCVKEPIEDIDAL